ncbi:MAG: SUMF1/EgtB/PvdO family nonheme iron enzyme [Myxococcales bacterium]|nr:SUMF1/EgtB/PvdO family nonheme iron enzyme [Myxococcales bacterium]
MPSTRSSSLSETLRDNRRYARSTKPTSPRCRTPVHSSLTTIRETSQPIVACVDWCDAYMFCQWAGKRLCGAVAGGSTPASSRANPNIDQWHNACTLGGSRTYPYGNTYTEGRCNDLTAATSGPFPVGGFPQCFGNHPGEAPVYDMSGDLQEWEDSCSGNSCAARGGDWLGYEGTAAFAQTDTANRDVRDHHRGFRCCWDPPN